MGAIKEFVIKQSIKHIIRTASKLSDKNLIRMAKLALNVAKGDQKKKRTNLKRSALSGAGDDPAHQGIRQNTA